MLQNTSALGDSRNRKHIDDRVLDIAGGDPDGAVFDIGMTAFVAPDLDAKRLVLKLLGQGYDPARQGRRKQQRAARLRRGLEDEFHILAKTQIEHLVGLVEHDGLQFGHVEPAAPQMIAQPARRADHDMSARGELALLAARVHAADAGNHARIGILIKPCEFALHLQRKFARRRDDQRQRCGGPREPLGAAEKIPGNGQAVSDGFAGAGLRRNQQVAVKRRRRKHGGLNGRELIVVALRQGASERRACGRECHEMADPGWCRR